MTEVEFHPLLNWAHSQSVAAIRGAYPRYWDENHITYRLLESLLRFRDGLTVTDLERPVSVRFDGFKARGPLEAKHGDVAIVVQRRSWEGETLTGVGFLEAKRRYPSSQEYDALDFSQLQTLLANTPHLQVLLYDYSEITGFGTNIQDSKSKPWWWDYRPSNTIPYTHALVVPAGIALSLKKRSVALHKYGMPWAHQLCARYMCGFDLDYRPEALSLVTEYVNRAQGGFTYVIVVRVDGLGELEDWNEVFPQPNADFYEPILPAV